MAGQILVVEDDEAMQTFYERALTAAGCAVTVAGDGVEALSRLDSVQPDMVLLDLGLPRMAGWEMLEIMRSSSRWQDLPVIIVTARKAPSSVAGAWSRGCTWYLTKPFKTDDLLLLVNRMLDTQQAQYAVS